MVEPLGYEVDFTLTSRGLLKLITVVAAYFSSVNEVTLVFSPVSLFSRRGPARPDGPNADKNHSVLIFYSLWLNLMSNKFITVTSLAPRYYFIPHHPGGVLLSAKIREEVTQYQKRNA